MAGLVDSIAEAKGEIVMLKGLPRLVQLCIDTERSELVRICAAANTWWEWGRACKALRDDVERRCAGMDATANADGAAPGALSAARREATEWRLKAQALAGQVAHARSEASAYKHAAALDQERKLESQRRTALVESLIEPIDVEVTYKRRSKPQVTVTNRSSGVDVCDRRPPKVMGRGAPSFRPVIVTLHTPSEEIDSKRREAAALATLNAELMEEMRTAAHDAEAHAARSLDEAAELEAAHETELERARAQLGRASAAQRAISSDYVALRFEGHELEKAYAAQEAAHGDHIAAQRHSFELLLREAERSRDSAVESHDAIAALLNERELAWMHRFAVLQHGFDEDAAENERETDELKRLNGQLRRKQDRIDERRRRTQGQGKATALLAKNKKPLKPRRVREWDGSPAPSPPRRVAFSERSTTGSTTLPLWWSPASAASTLKNVESPGGL